MRVSRDIAAAITPGRRTLAARLVLAALLSTLAACAAGNSTASVAPSTSAAPATASSPAPAAPAAQPAKPPPPEKLSSTEINETCWMDPEINKVRDLDKRAKLVDKCIDQKTKAQGGL